MNYFFITDKSSFDEIINCSILITGDQNRLKEEVYENMRAFSLDEPMAKNFSVKDLSDFIELLIQKRKQQLSGRPATFYLWLDEMVGQIRFNIISGHTRPPFECKLNLVDSTQEILEEFLKSNRGEISWGEMEAVEGEFEDEEDDDSSYELTVFVKEL